MSFSRLLRFFSDHLSITSSNSSAPKKEESSSNSSIPKKEESSSNTSPPKMMVSTSTSSIALLGVMLMASSTFIYFFYSKASSSNSSAPKKEESSSNSSEQESSSNSSAPEKEESSSNSSAPEKEASTPDSSEPKKEESSPNSNEPKIMASTSTTPIQKRFKYDVFLSFRGEDTRNNFLGHLYEALNAKGIVTYKDDVRIRKGKTINDELIKAIEDSRFYIIVFSKNYASSSWCLDELVKIIECQEKDEHTAYPVFYDVEPTEVRKQIGAVENAFSKNKEKEAAEKWKRALQEAGGLAGWALNDGDESELIKKIVGLISLELRSISFGSDQKLVGMETRVKDVVDSLEMGIDDDVWMIGIKGMGGAGKTTTARAVFDRLSADFEAKSFVANVREDSEPSMSGLKKLQEQVLSRVLNEQVTLDSVDDGKNMMQERMRGIKVLLVLDDVNDIDQLVALAGETNWFKKGSRIIVTTRDEQVLQAHRVNFRDIDLLSGKVDHRVKIRDIDLLSDEEAIFLLSRHAFGGAIPSQGFKKLSEKVVSYAAGLPLTVEVLGSFLCGKNEHEWVKAIDRLKKFPPEKILKKLELSYESLEYDYQQIFLDIACILKGLRREDAIRILECCGFDPITGLKVLEQRSLITVDEDRWGDQVLGMHDHIEEMGKNIVRREHPDEPYKHSRLWIKEEIEDILADDKGTEATRCLLLHVSNKNAGTVMKGLGKMKQLRHLEVYAEDLDNTAQYFPNSLKQRDGGCLDFSQYSLFYQLNSNSANTLYFDINAGTVMKGLGKMKQLRYLQVYFPYQDYAEDLDNTAQYFSNSLKYLKLRYYPFLYLPKTFQANNLVGLEMEDSKMVQLWEEGEKKVLKKLKFLSLSRSAFRTFDFSMTPSLETLILSSDKLVKLCMPVSFPELKHLNISDSKLRTFELGLTPSLEKLSLNYCADFEELHVSSACPNLKFLELRKSRLRSLDLELFPNLERLDLEGCDELVEINAPDGCLRKLVYLNLNKCLRLTDFVVPIGGLEPKYSCSSPSLLLIGESLDLCRLHPNSNLPKYQFYCNYKENLPSSVGNIEKLISFGLCACTDFKKLSDMICSLQCLRKLELVCDIPEFPKDLGKLECLEELYLSSTKIKDLPDSICKLKCLKSLQVYGDLLETLPENLGQLECLERLHVRSKNIEYLPDSICMLKQMNFLNLRGCALLEKLPENLGQLECLDELYVRSKKIKYLPDSICMLKRLKSIDVGECSCLRKLPEGIGQLESLERLDLTATMIKHLPDSICELKHLTHLILHHCTLLEKLPENLGQLECLEELRVWSMKIEYLPDSICMLKRLKSLDVGNCFCLGKLPEDIGQLESLERLILSSTKIKHLPDSICMLKHLKYLKPSSWCSS